MDAGTRKRIHEAMVRLADGDRSAFDVLLDDLWPVLLSFAERSLPRADAEDVAQEVFFKICSRIADFDRSRDALSWAFGIANYELLTQRRRSTRRREVHDDELVFAQSDAAGSQEERLIRHEVELALVQAIGALSDDDRLALGLSKASDSRAQSATLRKRKQRALERLKQLWRTIYGEP